MREETRHHDSDTQRQEKRRALRRSIGLMIMNSLLPDPLVRELTGEPDRLELPRQKAE